MPPELSPAGRTPWRAFAPEARDGKADQRSYGEHDVPPDQPHYTDSDAKWIWLAHP